MRLSTEAGRRARALMRTARFRTYDPSPVLQREGLIDRPLSRDQLRRLRQTMLQEAAR